MSICSLNISNALTLRNYPGEVNLLMCFLKVLPSQQLDLTVIPDCWSGDGKARLQQWPNKNSCMYIMDVHGCVR